MQKTPYYRSQAESSKPVDSTILNLLRLPARLDVHQTAILLGFREHDIPVLVKAGLIKPLGKPAVNAVRHFSAMVIEQLARDPEWLGRATNSVYRHWRKKREQEARAEERDGRELVKEPVRVDA